MEGLSALRAIDRINRQRHVLWVALALVAALSLFSSATNPLFEPPDELQHYQFVRYLVEERKLPVAELNKEASQTRRLFDSTPSGLNRPPLYYIIGALLVAQIDDPEEIPAGNPFWAYMPEQVSRDNKQQFLNTDSQTFPYNGTALTVHLLRLWSIALALCTVTVMWLLGRTLWPDDLTRMAAMLSIAVLNPMFLYLAGAVNNDHLIILFGTLILWLSVCALRDGFAWKTTVFIGLTWGLALLSKLTGLILAVPWGVALVLTARQHRDVLLFISRFAAVVGIALALSGWWFVRNLLLYGELFVLPVLGDWVSREQLGTTWTWHDLVYSWTTLWGRFAYGQVPLPRIIYWFCLTLSVVSTGGLIKSFVRVTQYRRWAQTRWPVWIVFLTTLVTFAAAAAFYMVNNPTGANARYIFPALSALSPLLVHGIFTWFSQWRRVVHKGIVAFMLGVALFSIGLFLPWTYAKPRLLTEALVAAQIETPADIVWGDGIALMGTAVSNRPVRQGENVNLRACWRSNAEMTTDYVFYVHLLDHSLNSLGQRDTYTGLGTFPTSSWKPGNMFCDTYLVPVSKELSRPVVVDVSTGFYDYDTRQQLPARTLDGIPSQHVVVGRVKLMPTSPAPVTEQQYRTEARFQKGVLLTGYSWSATITRPGETVSAAVAWEASGPLDTSYTIFAHLLNADGQMITQDDGLPQDGNYPTTFWGANEIIVDEHEFPIPEGTIPGPTLLLIGFYQLEGSRRLPRAAGADFPDAAMITGPMVVD